MRSLKARDIGRPLAGAALYIALTLLIVWCFQVLARDLDTDIRVIRDVVIACLSLPYIRIYLAENRHSDAFNRRGNLALCVLAAAVVVILTAYHFSIERLYQALYYLVVVAAGEELVFRAYLFRRLRKTLSFAAAAVVGGLMYGMAHGLFAYVIKGESIIAVAANLGGGVIGMLLYAYVFEKSKTIAVPICLHWALDYAGV